MDGYANEDPHMVMGSSSACNFHADAGLVCPVKVNAPTFNIIRYQDAIVDVQADVVRHLQKEWGYNREFIETQWSAVTGDVLYVMVGNNTGHTDNADRFIGCVAVDRKNFYPYISQLYVIEAERKRGHARKLLKAAEEYTRRMGFNTARIWCNTQLVPWYQKQGWIVDQEQSVAPKQILMYKSL
jgi:GNAT superfamily N-acetyltransferase